MSGKGELETEFLNIIDLLRGKKTNNSVKKVVKKVRVGGKGEDDDEDKGQINVKTGSNTPRPPIEVEELPIREEDPKVVEPKVVDPKVVDPKVIDPKVIDPKVIDGPIVNPAPVNPQKKIVINEFKEKLRVKLNEIIASESKKKAEEEEKKRKVEEQKQLNDELARKQQEMIDEQKRFAEDQAEWNSRLTAIQNLIVSNSGKVDNALDEQKTKIDEILKKVGETADKTTLQTEIDSLERALTKKVEKLNDAENQRHNGTVDEINNLKAMMQGNMKTQTNLYTDVQTEVLTLSGTITALEQEMNTKNLDMISQLTKQKDGIDNLYKQMNTANNYIEIISQNLNIQESEIKKLKNVVNDNKKSEEQNKNKLDESITMVREKMQGELKHIQAEYQKSIDVINEKLKNLNNSPDCCNDLKNQMIEMNAKIDKMQEEQNRIKLNGFKDKLKSFLEKIKGVSTEKSTGKSTETSVSTASTASIGTDMGPALGSEKLVSSI